MKKSYTISIPVQTFWRVVVPVLAAAVILGGLLGALAVDRLVMPHVTGVNKGIVAVPDVRGMEYESARQKLYDIGLVGRTKTQEFSDSVPVGSVLRQYVASGEQAKRGRQIDLAVSKGPEVAVVPPLKGLAEHIAKLELQKKGFTVGKVHTDFNEKVEAGKVVNAIPEEGTRISREMAVELEVSNGPKPTHAVVPNVVGEGLGSAKEKIESIGLKVGAVGNQNNPSLAPGTVVTQSVPPGTSIPFGGTVNLVVSVAR